MGEVWFILQFFQDFDLLGEVLRIVVVEEVFVGGPAEPVRVAPQLIREIGVVILQRILLHVFVGVGRPAAMREVASRVPVSRLNVLVLAAVAWEVSGVSAELGTRPTIFEEVFGHWPLNLIARLPRVPLEVCGVDIEMRTLESAVFLVVVNDIGDLLLADVAHLVDGVFGEVWLDNVEPAEVSAAVAVAAHTALLVVVEVALLQPPRSPVEAILLGEALVVVMPAALRLRKVVGSIQALHF